MDEELTYDILEQLIAKLTEIQQWFRTQRLYRFIASSILIAYEGYSQQSNKMQELNVVHLPTFKNCQKLSQPNKTLVEARMIDTAHVFTSSDLDSNYLFGLENIISAVERIRTNLICR